jgi:hypothetical protein
MLPHLQTRLLAMLNRDAELRAHLEADGTLLDGYHARMEEIHRTNAEELREIIEEHGWPNQNLVGSEAAEAAWLIAQHSISEPSFMRRCRAWLDEASNAGLVPRWQFAYIDDRIRVFEGKTQRFGTQFELKPDGPEINALMDPHQVDTWRREVGLGPISEVLSRAQGSPRPSPDEYASKQAEGKTWSRKVGWLP